MVPAMFERERLAADVRRAEWLAEALGPGTAKTPTAIRTRRREGRQDRASRFLATMANAIGDAVDWLRLAPRPRVPVRGDVQPR